MTLVLPEAEQRLRHVLQKAWAEVLPLSEAQKQAGNYPKTHRRYAGLEVSVENPAGSVREGTDEAGKPWRSQMYYDYGYVRRTRGMDGDQVDVYLGPEEAAEYAYVVHQADPATGRYDEDKVMLGFGSAESAKAAYLLQYDDPRYFGALSAVPLSLFKEKIFSDKGEPIVPDAARRVVAARLEGFIKHQPGRHDQTKHGRKGPGEAAAPAEGAQPAEAPATPASPTAPAESDFRGRVMAQEKPQEYWKSLTPAEKDLLADAKNTVRRRLTEELSFAGEADTTAPLEEVAARRVAQVGDYVLPARGALITQHMQTFGKALADSGVEEGAAKQLVLEATDALLVQESESMGRQLGDHGARHLLGDAQSALDILGAHPAGDAPAQTAAVYLAAVYHDTGYLTEPGGTLGMDGRHPEWSRQYYEAHVRPGVEAALGADWAERVGHIVATHAAPEMDWQRDPVTSAFRVADNLALFHRDKLPGVFAAVPANLKTLLALGEGKMDVEAARAEMRQNIGAAGLSGKVQSQLLKAVDEVGAATPKFTLGMLGGDYRGFKWAGEYLQVNVHRNRTAVRLQRQLDLGQRQFRKFAEAYLGAETEAQLGAEGFTFGDPPLLEFRIAGEVLKALVAELRLRAVLRKHQPGRHNQQRHAGESTAQESQAVKNLLAVREEIRDLRRKRISLTALAVTLADRLQWPHDTAMNMSELVLQREAPQGIRYVAQMNRYRQRGGKPVTMSKLLMTFLGKEGNWIRFSKFINEQEEVVAKVKHQPGAHDQASHGGEGGAERAGLFKLDRKAGRQRAHALLNDARRLLARAGLLPAARERALAGLGMLKATFDALGYAEENAARFEEALNALLRPVALAAKALPTQQIYPELGPAQFQLLLEVEQHGARPSPTWWWQWREEVVALEHAGLVEPADYATPQLGGVAGGTERGVRLTEAGRRALYVGRRETSGRLKALIRRHLPNQHDQQKHGRRWGSAGEEFLGITDEAKPINYRIGPGGTPQPLKDATQVRRVRPDEPHSEWDFTVPELFGQVKGLMIEDTSPPNPPGVSRDALKMWATPYTAYGRKVEDNPWHGEIRAAVARLLGVESGARVLERSPEHKLSQERIDEAARDLLGSLKKAAPAQPALWRGMTYDRNMDYEGVAKGFRAALALKPGEIFDVPLFSTTRDAGVADTYGGTARSAPSYLSLILKIAPGARGIAVRNYYPHDQEVITGGAFPGEIAGENRPLKPLLGKGRQRGNVGDGGRAVGCV